MIKKNKNIENINEKVAQLADNAMQDEGATDVGISPAHNDSEPENKKTKPAKKSKKNREEKTEEENNQKKKKSNKSKTKASFRDFIDGSILTRDYVIEQLPFLLFIMMLAMAYIANKYNSEKLIRETIATQNELKELKCEKIAVQSELMSLSKQSEIAKLIEEKKLDLYLLIEPPKKIVVPGNKQVSKQKE